MAGSTATCARPGNEVIAALQRAVEGRSILESTEPGQPPTSPLEALYITGHSLGGAMSALLAVMLMKESAYASIATKLRRVRARVSIEDVARQVETWTLELGWWLDRVAGVFARPEPRELLEQMRVGLLSPLPKKNGWTLAERAGHTHPGRIQTFLCRGAWDAAALEAHVRAMVVEALGDADDGVLIVDDTQIIKKGTKSVGVAPQHCGATNQVENCQVIVMLAYAGRGGHAFMRSPRPGSAVHTRHPLRPRRLPPRASRVEVGRRALLNRRGWSPTLHTACDAAPVLLARSSALFGVRGQDLRGDRDLVRQHTKERRWAER